MQATVSHLWRHPIKAHGVEAVEATVLETGRTMPWDRVWAIAQERAKLGDGASWAPCVNFGRGVKSPLLMAVRARTDEAAGTVPLSHPAREPLTVDPDDAADADRLLAWVAPLWSPDRPGPARVVRAPVGMTDSAFPSVAILNRASLAALGDRLGMKLAMERFRGNLWLDGLAPWQELYLVGRDLRIGGARVRVRERITRCKATTVDPSTGVSDADTLGALEAGWGHQDFGVYAEVVEGGRVAVGDLAEVLA
jgi:uncharacterized protein YcbX